MIPVSSSVIAVPPLARDTHLKAAAEPNRRIMAHIASGGIRIFLYGGNAVFYHIRPSEYAGILGMLAENAPAETDIVPSAGPSYGLSMDQAAILRDFPFPTAMVLPHQGLTPHTTRHVPFIPLLSPFRPALQARPLLVPLVLLL